MKEKEQYSLDEAIGKFYKTEPLKIDLAKTVANSVFGEEKKVSVFFDKMLYFIVCLIAVGAVIYCISLFSKLSISSVMLFLIIVVSFFGLSVKEHSVLSKKVLNFL
ncbi:MAG TPA: hypothetical protein VGA80_14855 [Flavobacteriaceae bacterium]|jgi:hypothetical protein